MNDMGEDTGSSANIKANTEHLAPYQFKKGESGNPKGRTPDTPEVKELKLLTKQQFKEMAGFIIHGDLDELERITKDKTVSVLKAMIASVAIKAISKGDMGTIDLLLNRLIGKVKDEVELSGQVNTVVRLRLPTNGREAK